MAAAAARSLSIFKRAAQFRRHQHFSSSSAANHGPWDFYYGDSEGEESAVYQHALKFQRPSTIKQHQVLHNSVSLIGKIDSPFRRINTTNGAFGLHTFLNVSASSHSRPSFKVMLKIWDEMAEVSMEHLKPKDLVYVWGHLKSYMKTDENGKRMMRHEVVVKEINFVTPDFQASACPELEKKESGGTDEDELEKYRNRIHLWQIFFASPYEWMDFRKSKVNPKYPDFKHRDAGEVLWLRTDDPPWIKRQLEILDSRFVYPGF
ncbi:protein OSB1, mitochondrial isoform X1 [Nicotiana tabacum]|uniref:Protein OSB1, mitochondrial isoform X1 n=1 Tax=Nicotiana tabacum TaxID=4097 RepID=A0A1S4BQ57_TOBAC|nr:PREDICTED: protein OSB1, mitochondrial-like isoform X1 [Nicotiana tabacum]